jgi:hypothetical protein
MTSVTGTLLDRSDPIKSPSISAAEATGIVPLKFRFGASDRGSREIRDAA